METKTGTIRFIKESSGSSDKGPWKRYEFEFDDGFKIATFDSKVGTAFKPGDNVIMSLSQNGQYKQLVTMEANTAKVQTETSTDRSKSIIAQALTKAWTTSEVTPTEVLEAYKFFLENV